MPKKGPVLVSTVEVYDLLYRIIKWIKEEEIASIENILDSEELGEKADAFFRTTQASLETERNQKIVAFQSKLTDEEKNLIKEFNYEV